MSMGVEVKERVCLPLLIESTTQHQPPTTKQIEPNQLMMGYLYVGNWYSYTVSVNEPGTYSATLFASSHHGGDLSFDVDLQV